MHGRSHADGLIGRGCNRNLEAIADLKISAAGTGRVVEVDDRVLCLKRKGSDRRQKKQTPHLNLQSTLMLPSL
jgi:hypothetical protein